MLQYCINKSDQSAIGKNKNILLNGHFNTFVFMFVMFQIIYSFFRTQPQKYIKEYICVCYSGEGCTWISSMFENIYSHVTRVRVDIFCKTNTTLH